VVASLCITITLGTLIAFVWTGFSFSEHFTSKKAVFDALIKEIIGVNILVTAIAVPLIFII
jgi:hypothetical protein